MKPIVPALKALPSDASPDSGPQCRGGLFSFAAAFSSGLVALGLSAALFHEDHPQVALLCLAFFVLIAALAAWSLTLRLRYQRNLPRSHAVLTDHLGFRIDFTCSDVAMTAFLHPDTLEAGQATSLLCFVENYASRQRIANFLIGPHPHLGLAEAHPLRLQLAAGQAALYVLPLHCSISFSPGGHDLPIALSVEKPNGEGVLLPGARRHLHKLWNVHFAAPFTIQPRDPTKPRTTTTQALRQAGFHSLASVSEKTPKLAILETLG